MTPEQMTREFHTSKRIHAGWMPDRPTTALPPGLADLRQALLDEEVTELHEAVNTGDITKIADALGDIAYVLSGTAVTYGLPFPVEFTPANGLSLADSIPDTIAATLLESADWRASRLRDAIQTAKPLAIGEALLHFAVQLDNIAILYGIPLGAVFEAVHLSNMTKINTPAEGKLMKGPGYRPPRIAEILASPGYTEAGDFG
jgi:predicted HAD superfamily Cof-like phosphohydrolase